MLYVTFTLQNFPKSQARMTQQYWYFYVMLYCIFSDKTAGKWKHKQEGILV